MGEDAAPGRRASARALIPHVDDLGVSHGANRAFIELAGLGFVTCGSAMAPCSWFPEIVDLAKERPALGAGLDVTHLDTHMGAAAAPEFAGTYVALGRDYRLPVLIIRNSASYDSVLELGPIVLDFYDRLVAELDGEGVPLIDRFAMGLAMRNRSCDDAFRHVVQHAAPGTTYLSLHCNAPGDIEDLHPGDAAWRIAEYHLLQEPDFLGWVAAQDVDLIGFRALRDRYRARLTKA